MATATEIAQMACRLIKQDPIQNLDTSVGIVADECRQFYPIALGETLAKQPALFTERRENLSQETSDLDEWAYRYTWPAAAVHLVRVHGLQWTPGQAGLNFHVGWLTSANLRKIYLQESEAAATYVSAPAASTVGQLNELFQKALFLRLAGYLSATRGTGPNPPQVWFTLADDALRDAGAVGSRGLQATPGQYTSRYASRGA